MLIIPSECNILVLLLFIWHEILAPAVHFLSPLTRFCLNYTLREKVTLSAFHLDMFSSQTKQMINLGHYWIMNIFYDFMFVLQMSILILMTFHRAEELAIHLKEMQRLHFGRMKNVFLTFKKLYALFHKRTLITSWGKSWKRRPLSISDLFEYN